jgi:hypothetical protein
MTSQHVNAFSTKLKTMAHRLSRAIFTSFARNLSETVVTRFPRKIPRFFAVHNIEQSQPVLEIRPLGSAYLVPNASQACEDDGGLALARCVGALDVLVSHDGDI